MTWEIDRAQGVRGTRAFDEARGEIAYLLEEVLGIDTVDLIVYDRDTQTVRLGITSWIAEEEFHRDAAWAVARDLAFMWNDEFWMLSGVRDPIWWPSFSITVDSASFDCGGETMRNLLERRIDRRGWQAACGEEFP